MTRITVLFAAALACILGLGADGSPWIWLAGALAVALLYAAGS